MAKKSHIRRYSDKALAELQRRGATKSDWARSAAMTADEIEASVAADPDEAGMIVDWENASAEMPAAQSGAQYARR